MERASSHLAKSRNGDGDRRQTGSSLYRCETNATPIFVNLPERCQREGDGREGLAQVDPEYRAASRFRPSSSAAYMAFNPFDLIATTAAIGAVNFLGGVAIPWVKSEDGMSRLVEGDGGTAGGAGFEPVRSWCRRIPVNREQGETVLPRVASSQTHKGECNLPPFDGARNSLHRDDSNDMVGSDVTTGSLPSDLKMCTSCEPSITA